MRPRSDAQQAALSQSPLCLLGAAVGPADASQTSESLLPGLSHPGQGPGAAVTTRPIGKEEHSLLGALPSSAPGGAVRKGCHRGRSWPLTLPAAEQPFPETILSGLSYLPIKCHQMQGWDDRCCKAEGLKVCVPIVLPLLLLLAAEERDIESSTQLSVANKAGRGKELEEYLKGMQEHTHQETCQNTGCITTSSTPVGAYAFILR